MPPTRIFLLRYVYFVALTPLPRAVVPRCCEIGVEDDTVKSAEYCWARVEEGERIAAENRPEMQSPL